MSGGGGIRPMRLGLSRPEPGRPARLPDALPCVALFLANRSAADSRSNPARIKGVRKNGGGGGIRTHVAARTAKSISSRPRYGHFGTPPRGEGGIIAGEGASFKRKADRGRRRTLLPAVGGHSFPASRRGTRH